MDDSGYKQDKQYPSLVHLFLSFLRLGATAFGGPAMIAHMHQMAVDQKRWLDEKTARDGIALCQTIPGATAMQMSAYVGFRARGVRGAAASFIGFGLPAFLLMMGLSALYVRTHTLPSVISIFNGLQTIVVAIVANAALSFGKTSVKNWKNALNSLMAAVLFGLKLNPISVILIAAFSGAMLYPKQSVKPAVNPQTKPHSQRSLLWLFLAAVSGSGVLFILNRRLFDLPR